MHNMRLACNLHINILINIATGACLDFNGVLCDHCDIEMKGNDTNFKY